MVVANHILLAISVCAAVLYVFLYVKLTHKIVAELEAWDRGEDIDYSPLTLRIVMARAVVEVQLAKAKNKQR